MFLILADGFFVHPSDWPKTDFSKITFQMRAFDWLPSNGSSVIERTVGVGNKGVHKCIVKGSRSHFSESEMIN